MTDMYTESQGSKKKYLIPLVVLLLCAVSLTGAGYAYNSSVTTNGDQITTDAELLVITNDDTAANATLKFGVDFISTTTNGNTSWSFDATHSQLEKQFNIQLKSTTGAQKTVTFTIGATTSTISDVTYAVKLYSDAEHQNELANNQLNLTGNADATTVYAMLIVSGVPGASYTPAPADHTITFSLTASTNDIEHSESA